MFCNDERYPKGTETACDVTPCLPKETAIVCLRFHYGAHFGNTERMRTIKTTKGERI